MRCCKPPVSAPRAPTIPRVVLGGKVVSGEFPAVTG